MSSFDDFFFMSIFWSIKINFQMKKFSRWSVNWASHSPSFLFNLESRNWRWKSDDADDEKISPRERAPTACICAKRHIRSVGCRVRERESRKINSRSFVIKSRMLLNTTRSKDGSETREKLEMNLFTFICAFFNAIQIFLCSLRMYNKKGWREK